MRSGTGSGRSSSSSAPILVTLTRLSIPTSRTTMPHMSLFELLFALLLVCVLAGVAAVALLAWNLMRRADVQALAVAELRQRLDTGGLTQESRASELRERLAQTQSVVERLGSALVARQSIEDEARSSLKRLESVIAGSSTRGAAGEHILEEVLKHLPPEMLQRNVWVGGKVVELALQLPGGKLLPIDSKWVSSGALEQLAEPGLDAARRAQLAAQVEREVERRVREVSQYIDPAATSTFALAVIPDAAYDVCRGAIVSAHRRHVMVVGYAMALPYLLTLYQLHLQFARTVDMERLQAALIDVERHLDTLEAILDNKLQRSLTVLQNAYTEGKQASARIRASARSAQINKVPGDKAFSSPSHGEVARSAGGAADDNVSTDSPGAAGDLSTETLHLALLDSAQ